MDERFMQSALDEARKGLGWTHPNPAVGAVIVRNHRIVARGWHRGAGRPHAEIEAIRACSRTQGATLYVTLEPCSTQGRTPPCTDALVSAGFSRVVYGATDPNPRHAGRAARILRRRGIAVTAGVLAKPCVALNAAWNKWIATGRPYVIAKAGLSLDGRINSPPAGRWLTNPRSRRDVMVLRTQVQAILVGAGTVRADNPRLTIRGIRHREQPLRVVWSPSGRLPRTAHLFTDAHRASTVVYRTESLREILDDLGRRGVAAVLIEGGAQVLGAAFDGRLVDEVRFYLAPLVIGGPVPVTGGLGAGCTAEGFRLRDTEFLRLGDDVRLTGRPVYPD